MSDTNLHILNGRLTDSPKFKTCSNGNVSVYFRVATSVSYKDKEGTWQQRDEFHNVSTFITQANLPYWTARCIKGKRIQIVGECRTERVGNPDGTTTYYSFTAALSKNVTLPELVANSDVKKSSPPPQLYPDANGDQPASSFDMEEFSSFN